MKILVKGARLVDPQQKLNELADVLIVDGKIAKIASSISAESDTKCIEAAGKYLIPGPVDVHTHFRDPGYEYKETIATGSRAAVKGGYTGVATMPNTDPVSDTGSLIRYQLDRGEEANLCHIYPLGALTRGSQGEALAEIGDMVEAGAYGFSDDGHGVQSAAMMRTCMEYVSMFDKPVLVHAEDKTLSAKGVVNEGRISTRLGMFGQPALSEELEVMRDIELCRLTGCSLHICHISTARSLELIKTAKSEGLPVSCEVTPHHLFLCEDDISDRYQTNLKMNPPLRTKKDMEALQAGLIDGSIDMVATDHAPHAVHEKDCEFEIAFFGTLGLETAIPLLLTHLVIPKRMSWESLVERLCVAPRKLLRLEALMLKEGNPADLTLIDPHSSFVADASYFEGKAKNSAFLDQRLTGRATEVIFNGKLSLEAGKVVERGDVSR